jgi:hypothetical protein
VSKKRKRPERRPATGAGGAARATAAGTRAATAGTAEEAAGKPAEPDTAKAPEAPSGLPPLRLAITAAVAGLEGLAVAVWGIVTLFAGSSDAVLGGLLIILLAALPLGAAYGLLRARRWSRGPALIMQLISLPIAWTMLHSDGAVVPGGAVLGLLALLGLVLLVHPATTDALGISRTPTP